MTSTSQKLYRFSSANSGLFSTLGLGSCERNEGVLPVWFLKMGDETCKECRSWEEEMYWTRFQSIHFTQTFLTDFDRCLPLPVKFTESLKKKLPDTVNLVSPSAVSWEVAITAVGGLSFFTEGWEEFSNLHKLKENDLLVFKYNGKASFHVLIFDGASRCEKEAAYFVRKCGSHEQHDRGSSVTEEKGSEPTFEVIVDSDDDVDGVTDRRTRRKTEFPDCASVEESDDSDSNPALSKGKSVSPPGHSANRRTRQRIRCSTQTRTVKIYLEDEEFDDLDTDTADAFPNCKNGGQSKCSHNCTEYLPNRRPVTDVEKANALKSALAALSSKGFMTVMRPTAVYYHFFLSIPSSWLRMHLPSLLGKEVILRAEETTWQTKFYCQRDRSTGGLSSGWRQFVVDNMLHEGDVCVFEPDGLKGGLMVLQVTIFRVVPEARPLIPLR